MAEDQLQRYAILVELNLAEDKFVISVAAPAVPCGSAADHVA
jgi:hypothetical protein